METTGWPGVRILVGTEDFFFPKLPDPFWAHAALYLRGTVSFQGLRGLGYEVSH